MMCFSLLCLVAVNPLLTPPATIGPEEVLASFQEVTDVIGVSNRWFAYHNGGVSLHIEYDALPEEFTPEERLLFKFDGDKYVFQFGPNSPRFGSRVEPLLDGATPRLATVASAAELILGGRTVLFEGAGVSAAAGVHTIHRLWKHLEIDPDKRVDPFVRTSLHHPEQVVTKILSFVATGRDAPPTAAHHALKALSQRIGCQIVSGNFDRLHERTGIRPYRLSDHKWTRELTVSDYKEIDLIVCLGMSHDIDGFLASYKQNNPGGRLLAVDYKTPDFLGSDDYFLEGDLQKLLPVLAQELSNE
jgi:NAD-dependent SIR2 family protein deacetylase